MARRLRRRAHVPASGAAAARAADLQAVAASARTSSSTGRRTPARCSRSASRSSCSSTRIQRLQGLLPLNPMGFSTAHAPANATPMTPDLAFNTAVSFMTNTNWQSYVGETTMSYFAQMAALTVQNFTSAAAGIAIAIALIARLRAPAGEDDRQLLGRPDARAPSTSCCRSRSSAALLFCVAGRDAELRRPTRRSRRSRARRRRSRRGRWPRRKRSRCSAPTAAASSTPTPRIRSRTRRRSTNFLQIVADLPDPGGPDLHVRRDGRRSRGRAGRCSRR